MRPSQTGQIGFIDPQCRMIGLRMSDGTLTVGCCWPLPRTHIGASHRVFCGTRTAAVRRQCRLCARRRCSSGAACVRRGSVAAVERAVSTAMLHEWPLYATEPQLREYFSVGQCEAIFELFAVLRKESPPPRTRQRDSPTKRLSQCLNPRPQIVPVDADGQLEDAFELK